VNAAPALPLPMRDSPSLMPRQGRLSDAELLARVVRAELDPGAAHRAQGELYARHVRYLYGVVLRQSQQLLRAAGMSAEDLVQETFQRAFERAHTFDPGGDFSDERLGRRTRAWLGRIAERLLADALARSREVPATPYLERLTCESIDEPVPASPQLALVIAGLRQLSEREQDVLRVTALYHRVGEPHQRLPNAVSEQLAARWDTTSENVRAIRSRALKKLRAILTAQGPNLGEAT